MHIWDQSHEFVCLDRQTDSKYSLSICFEQSQIGQLEVLFASSKIVAFRDFAHAPSKLKATLAAVREAYPDHELIACFELHTFSSLSETFLVMCEEIFFTLLSLCK